MTKLLRNKNMLDIASVDFAGALSIIGIIGIIGVEVSVLNHPRHPFDPEEGNR